MFEEILVGVFVFLFGGAILAGIVGLLWAAFRSRKGKFPDNAPDTDSAADDKKDES